MERQASCKERVRSHYKSRIDTIKLLWESYRKDPEAYVDGEGRWDEYGLSFDYVPAGTFTDQKRGYFRYQISWGGPSDELRFFTDEDLNLTSIQYWFLDWGDGAKVIVNGKARELLGEIWDDWKDCEVPQYAMKKARE